MYVVLSNKKPHTFLYYVLSTLGSVYSTKASGAEQVRNELKQIIEMKQNKVNYLESWN